MNDQATINDALNRNTLLKHLVQHIVDCDPPEVIGIHGAWGTGKTSFLYQLQLELSGMCPQCPEWRSQQDLKKKRGEKVSIPGNENVYVIWFEAWRYQHDPNPIIALLHEMRAQFQWHIRFFQEISKLSEVAVRAMLDKLSLFQKALAGFDGAVNLLKIDAKGIVQHGEKWEKEHFATKLPSNAVREVLNDAISKLLAPDHHGKKRVVVIIDDLDRCDSKMAYQLLEGLKVYLNLDRCIFVLAYDPDALEASIRSHILGADKDDDQSAQHAQMAVEYLEKICPNPWALPSDYEPSRFLHENLEGCPFRKELCDLAQTYRLLPLNPRRIKSFVHTLRRFAKHANLLRVTAPNQFNAFLEQNTLQTQEWTRTDITAIADDHAFPALVLTISYIYHFHREHYRALEMDESAYLTILDWCKGEPVKQEHKPLFKNITLPLHAGSAPAFSETLRVRNFYAQRLMIALDKAPATAKVIRPLLLRENRNLPVTTDTA